MDKIKNPKIIIAALAGFLLPNLASYLLRKINHNTNQHLKDKTFIGL